MDQRISIITLGVADLNRSREFYERLGWRRSMANTEGIVFFQAGGMALALFPRSELAKDTNISPDGHGFSGMTLAYNTQSREEVDSLLAQAQAAGPGYSNRGRWPHGVGIPDTLRIRTGFCGKLPGILIFRWRPTEASTFQISVTAALDSHPVSRV